MTSLREIYVLFSHERREKFSCKKQRYKKGIWM